MAKNTTVLYDWVARIKLRPFSKILFADICNVTFNFKERVYKFSSKKGAARIKCSQSRWFAAKRELEAADLIKVKKVGNLDLGKPAPKHLIPLFNPLKGDPVKGMKRGAAITKAWHADWYGSSSIPVYLDGIHSHGALACLVWGLHMINHLATPTQVARHLNISRQSAHDKLKLVAAPKLLAASDAALHKLPTVGCIRSNQYV